MRCTYCNHFIAPSRRRKVCERKECKLRRGQAPAVTFRPPPAIVSAFCPLLPVRFPQVRIAIPGRIDQVKEPENHFPEGSVIQRIALTSKLSEMHKRTPTRPSHPVCVPAAGFCSAPPLLLREQLGWKEENWHRSCQRGECFTSWKVMNQRCLPWLEKSTASKQRSSKART